MIAGPATPAARLAARPLFGTLAPWLAALPGDVPPSLEQLRRWLDTAVPRPASGGGVPLQFVPADPAGVPYEQRIHMRGEISTREANWHDAFNSLVWLRFPHTKAALNARHVRELRDDGVRGAARDAATLFDESGVIVACADDALADALREHRWREAFVQRRQELVRRVRFVVFGHALYDQLRAPFHGLCGKALYLTLPQEAIGGPDLAGRLDAMLAARLGDRNFLATPAVLRPLPMLGIPGVVPGNENPAYYDDASQFRPRPRVARAG